MKQKVVVTILDEVSCKFTGILPQHNDYLNNKYSLLIENHKFDPRVKLGIWDGKIQFFHRNGNTSVYLLPEIVLYLQKVNYEVHIDDKRSGLYYDVQADITEDYFSHITNKKTGEPYKLTDHQIEAANTMIASGSGIALAGTGFGKAQPLFCKVLTPTGWREMGDLVVGDYVVTPTNRYVQIKEVIDQGVTDVYSVHLDDGSFTYAHPEHLWKVQVNEWVDRFNFKTLDVINTLELRERIQEIIYLPAIPTPIDFEEKPVDIDPYLMGLIIGNGTPIKESIYIKSELHYRYTNSVKSYDSYFMELGFGVSYKAGGIYLLPTDETKDLFDKIYKKLVDQDKLEDYIFNDIRIRQRFLNGFFDMYGHIRKDGVSSFMISNTWAIKSIKTMISLQSGALLADQRLVNLVCSHRDPTYFYTNEYKIKYYQNNKKTQHKGTGKRKVKSVLYEGKMETRCIAIADPDHLYITDGCMITHNTILNAVLVDKYNKQGCKTLTIVPAVTLINQTLEQFRALGLNASHFNSNNPSIESDHIISTWQTLQNYPLLINEFQMVVVDECLDENTMILTENGTKPIKDIVVGEKVFSYNIETKQFELDDVMKLHRNLSISSDEKMYRLEFDQGTIEVTGNHKILTIDGYKRADQLTEEDDIISF